jgi:hypothetical protein
MFEVGLSVRARPSSFKGQEQLRLTEESCSSRYNKGTLPLMQFQAYIHGVVHLPAKCESRNSMRLVGHTVPRLPSALRTS